MDIEKLKDARHTADYTTVSKLTEMDWTELREISKELIDEAIARQYVTGVGETSDGYHTFNELYEHRTALFAALCNIRSDISWKSMKHSDGTMYEGMFIAGIETPDGQYTYHCDMKYLYMFAYTPEVENAPPYDGHQPKDYPRLLGLSENSLYRQIARQTTSEEVQEAIETLENQNRGTRMWAEKINDGADWEKLIKTNDLAITALQAYQPVAIPKTETISCELLNHNMNYKKCSSCNYLIHVYVNKPNYCPNCGRRLEEKSHG